MLEEKDFVCYFDPFRNKITVDQLNKNYDYSEKIFYDVEWFSGTEEQAKWFIEWVDNSFAENVCEELSAVKNLLKRHLENVGTIKS